MTFAKLQRLILEFLSIFDDLEYSFTFDDKSLTFKVMRALLISIGSIIGFLSTFVDLKNVFSFPDKVYPLFK